MDNNTNSIIMPIALPKFSIFPPGHVNTKGVAVLATEPIASTDIYKVYQFIISDRWAGNATEELRKIEDHNENSQFKKLNFYTATFSGVFSYRNASSLVTETPYLVIDIDEEDIRKGYPNCSIDEAIQDLRKKLIADMNLVVVLAFVSPNGCGLKLVIHIADKQGLSHREVFDAVSMYIRQRYHVSVDTSGSDICRACFLPYDPDCYIDVNYQNKTSNSINLKVWLKEKQLVNKAKQPVRVLSDINGSYTNDNVFDLVERWVSQSTIYAPGSFNRYVCKCGYLLCEFGVSQSEAEQWAIARFSDYRSHDVSSIIRSCYRNGNFGTKNYINNTKIIK